LPGPSRWILLFLSIGSFACADTLSSLIREKIVAYFEQQQRVVSVSVIVPKDREVEDPKSIKFPDRFVEGRQKVWVGDMPIFFVSAIQELIPVLRKNRDKGTVIQKTDLETAWKSLHKINPFTIRNNDNIRGKVSRYYKKGGEILLRSDLKDPIAIHIQDLCTIRAINGKVSVSMPAIALKNGCIGCKIRVLNKHTGKVLEAMVIDSKNVEVRM